MRLDQLCHDLAARLPDTENALFDLDQLLSAVEIPPSWRLSRPETQITSLRIEQLRALVGQRAEGIPLAYVLGQWEFYALPLQINPQVLIPRPDTEVLVEILIKRCPNGARVLDLGTGSGAIAIALKHERPDLQLVASDISVAAIELATANAQALKLEIDFVHSDWFQELPPPLFDVILSNPPYLAQNDPHLPALSHEPQIALVSGPSGLEAYEHLVSTAISYLKKDGFLAFEHGNEQAQALQDLFKQSGYQNIETFVDYAHRPRVSLGHYR